MREYHWNLLYICPIFGELISDGFISFLFLGGGVVMANGVDSVVKLAEQLKAPVCNTYLHNDSFPTSHELWMGPLGYQV